MVDGACLAPDSIFVMLEMFWVLNSHEGGQIISSSGCWSESLVGVKHWDATSKGGVIVDLISAKWINSVGICLWNVQHDSQPWISWIERLIGLQSWVSKSVEKERKCRLWTHNQPYKKTIGSEICHLGMNQDLNSQL